jgi:diguanylate cyclase (GGDEF)-like protein
VTNLWPPQAPPTPRLNAHRLLDCVDDAILVLSPSLDVVYANAALADFTGPVLPDESAHVASLIHPDDALDALHGFEQVVHSGERAVLRFRVREADGWRPIEATFTNRLADADVGGIVVCFRNLTAEERYRESLSIQLELAERNRALHEQLRERQHFLSRLVRIQASISRRAPLNEVLGAIVEGVHQLVGDPVITLQVQEVRDHDRLVLLASHGVPDASVRRSQSAEHGIAGQAYRENCVVHCADPPVDDVEHTALADLDVRNGVSVPIRRAGQAIGALTVATSNPGRVYSAAEREVLESLADHAGIAIMDAQTVESMKEALSDPLTGLPNRRLLIDRLRQSIDRAQRYDRPVAVLFIDLDGFKAINDGRGHAAGDAVLVEMARRIGAAIRTHDTAARIGGDEFVVMLEETNRFRALEVAERLLHSLAQTVVIHERPHVVSATIGVAMIDQDERGVVDAEELVRRADIAMYRGKAGGRGQVVFFEDRMEREVEARTELESELRHAVASCQIDVAFQPVYRTSDLSLHSVEALARWFSPAQGVVSPAEFIPLATQLGLIPRLDRCVMIRACRALLALGAAADGVLLNVNLSPPHIDAPDLVDGIADFLQLTGMPASRIVLEITETDALRDPEGAVLKLRELKRLGVHLAIDDFGTGYSSLTYLERFPIDTVKIDRDFISALARGGRARHLTESMIQLAHSMGMQVVAEGVETAEQAAIVVELGADLSQGYFHRRPMPESELAELLRDPATRR